MADVHELRPKTPDSEKITVNLCFIDLGRVDLMVRDGFYANRADFIRTAIRNQLERQDDAVRQSGARRQLKPGWSHHTRQVLEQPGAGRPHPLKNQTSRTSARHPACIDAGQESTIMNAFSKIDMSEVTRLTQVGKLAEAMALLQGQTASDIARRSPGSEVPRLTLGIKRP